MFLPTRCPECRYVCVRATTAPPATVAIGKDDDDAAALTGEMATGARCRYSQRRRCVEAGDWWKEGGTSSFKYQRGETPDTSRSARRTRCCA